MKTIVLLIALISCNSLYSRVIFVDNKLSGNCKNTYSIVSRTCTGSDGDAYNTISGAANIAVAMDTVLIRAGIYSEQLAPKNSGSENKYIVFKNFEQDSVLLTGANLNPAIWIDRKSYIVIEGLIIKNVTHWTSVLGSNHIIIQKNKFYNATDPNGSSKTGIFFQNSNYNRITGNWIDSSSQDNLAFIKSDYNYVEGNVILRAAHTLWTIKCSRYNILRNNFFHNQFQKIGEIYDCDEVGYGNNDFPKISSKDDTKYNIIDGNYFAYTSTPIDKSPYAGIQLAAQHTIVRRNVFFRCIGPPIDLTNYSAEAEFTYGNRIYNNVFYNNHFGGISIAGTSGYKNTDNSIINNIFYKNNFIKYDSRWDWYSTLNNKPVQLITGRIDSFVFKNNSLFSSTVDEPYTIAYGSRTSSTNPAPQTINWWETNYPSSFVNNMQIEPVFVDTAKIDYRLVSTNGLVDKGAFLTKTINNGQNETIMLLDDAGFFSDGFGIYSGDTIQLENDKKVSVILSINYTNRGVILKDPLSWTADQRVSLKYSGAKPDIGAFEDNQSSVGIEEEIPARDQDFTIVPNPSTEKLYFESKNEHEISTIQIINETGVVVYEGNFMKSIHIDTKHFANGVYFCRIYSGNVYRMKPIVVMR